MCKCLKWIVDCRHMLNGNHGWPNRLTLGITNINNSSSNQVVICLDRPMCIAPLGGCIRCNFFRSDWSAFCSQMPHQTYKRLQRKPFLLKVECQTSCQAQTHLKMHSRDWQRQAQVWVGRDILVFCSHKLDCCLWLDPGWVQ